MNKIGIIAGGGQFPILFARAAREQGRQVMIAAHKGESSPELEDAADKVCWVKLGQLGKIIKFFRGEGVDEAVLLGTITKTRIFKDILPDLKGLALWNRLKVRQDDSILRAVAEALEEEGIKILESTLYLQKLFFPKGVLTNLSPSPEQTEDIIFGWQMARAVGKLDIGQCVVVRDKTVLAVEAIEGTDAAIRRGGSLGKEKSVVVKVKKPGQDFRFDLPAIGVKTIESMREVGASVLAVEAGQALLFDAEAMIERANQAGIIVVGVEEQEDGRLEF
ncbi:MAG: UDP-2,3-diacylglucosamine diphosphatase LpxI [Proteobacteria bacterium]|nr:UDP-2,3-diacylglucosamine diphosphatase LpxI [Pseudomonadota bacterium]MBU1738609.1 UDP-2,3-diacylglucosamine diphosphatase LpxI [Pseudomonadota bacterium]